MIANKKHNICGIYCIKNMINNKVYIGKSKNVFQRIKQHIKALDKKRIKEENSHLIASWHKYGKENFDYFILEYLDIANDLLVSERELFWMKKLNALNRDFGYNFRSDSSTKMITHALTSKKISERLKKEWLNGDRKEHGSKLKKSWENDTARKEKQSKLLSKTLTKFKYLIYTSDEEFLKECNYRELVNLGLQNAINSFHKKQIDYTKCKKNYVKKVKIDDIVQNL